MVRDWNRDEAYFDAYIEKRDHLILETENRLERGEIREDRVRAVSRDLVRDMLHATMASYSRGDPMPEVARRGRLALDEFSRWGLTLSFADLWLVSLAALVHDGPAEMARLRGALWDQDAHDWAFDLLLGDDPASIAGEPERHYHYLRAVFDAPEGERPAEMARRLSRWYSSMRGDYWWGFHRKVDRCLYFGYWALEYAALARRLRVDDSALEGKRYYPYELAHWLDGGEGE